MPNARFCVPCQELLGDVLPIRRYDDTGADGETHSTYYTSNHDLEREMFRRNRATEQSVRLIDADQTMPSASAPDPENTSVRATNLGSAVNEQDDVIRRETGKFTYTERRTA